MPRRSHPRPPGARVAAAAAAWALALAVLPGGFLAAAKDRSLPFSSSVILFGAKDMSYIWRQDARVSSWCAQIGNEAKKAGSDSVSVVLTQNWMPIVTSYECVKPDDCRPRYDHYGIKYYCWRDVQGSDCKPFTWQAIDDFRDKLTSCLGTLMEQGFKTIMLTPHLDNAVDANQWRNWLRMNPNEKIDGFSFWDILLNPISQAINANLKTREVTFLVNLQGEMGTSLFGHPQEYQRLKRMVRDATKQGGKDWLSPRVKIGFKINFEKVAGDAAKLGGGIDADMVRKIFKSVEFVAISAYAPVNDGGFGPDDMQRSAEMADGELRQWGVESLKKKKLYYGEFGVGGGTSPYCDKLAKSAHEAAQTPQYGTCWQYQPPMDPWRNSQSVRDFMRRYYEAALDWLDKGTGPKYYISGIFAWNLVSWDVQGIHPLSKDGAGESFRDDLVAGEIADHNKKVLGQ